MTEPMTEQMTTSGGFGTTPAGTPAPIRVDEAAPDYVHHGEDQHSHKHVHGERGHHYHRHHHEGGEQQHVHGTDDPLHAQHPDHSQHHMSS